MKCILPAILICLCGQLWAQPFHFTTYTTSSGLSSNRIITTEKDSSGFLWIGTLNGLNRFDGHMFDHFLNVPNDSTSISSNEIQTLFTDQQQQLWVGTVNGISKYNRHQQNFINYAPGNSAGKCGRSFGAMAQDKNNNFWVGCWYELLIFTEADKKFKRSGWADYAATHKPVNGNNSRIVIVGLLKKSADELWILSTYGLYSVHTSTKVFKYYPNNFIDDYLGCTIKYIDNDGVLWMGSYNKGLFAFDPKKNEWRNYKMPASWLSQKDFFSANSIVQFNNDTLFYCGLDGIAFFDRRQEKFISQVTHGQGNQKVYSAAAGVAVTAFDNAWWITSTDGLIKMDKPEQPVTRTMPFDSTDWIDYVFPTGNQQLLIGNSSKNTIIFFDETTGKKTFVKDKKGQLVLGNLTGYHRLTNDDAIISTENSVYRLNMQQLIADSIVLPAKRFPQNAWTLRNIVQANSTTLCIRSRQQGIIEYDLITGNSKFIDFVTPSFEKAYAALYADSSTNTIWVSIENEGLYLYNLSAQKTARHFLNASTNSSFTVNTISADGKGNLFFADVHRGFFVYNPATKSTRQYTMQDGLPSNNCYRTTIDQNGTVWISTAEGICSFDPTLQRFTGFDNDDLFPKNTSQIVAGNKAIYAVGSKAFYKWLPVPAQQKVKTSVIYLRKITINDVSYSIDKNYDLNYRDNNIVLQFGAMNFDVRDQPVLMYSINKGTWTRLDKDGRINFINLSPGKYAISVKEHGTDNLYQLNLLIHPPFWKTWWFLSSCVIALSAISFYFIKLHIKRIRTEAELKQRVAETEVMALRAQMNPHFIFNCISSIDNFILGNDKEQASSYLNKFARLIRNILDNSKNDVVPFWKDWETMQLYLQLESLRANHKFTYELKAADELLEGHYKIPPLIIQPYIENAIHHGLLTLNDNSGQLIVTATIKDDVLTYNIRDNGIGREKAAQAPSYGNIIKASYGLQLSAERIRLFNGDSPGEIIITDLKDDEGCAAGTLVQVSLQV